MTGTKRPTVCVILMLGLIVTSVAVCANPAGARSRPAAPTRSHDSPPPTVPPSAGYWLTTGYGSSYAFDVPYLGNVDTGCATCINSVSSTPSGKGYWMAGTPDFATPGGNHVNAQHLGVVGCQYGGPPHGLGLPPSAQTSPVVGIAATDLGAVVATSGGVVSECGISTFGSMQGQPLNAPIVGIAATPDGNGYWLVASDGGVFAFGDAKFYGSMGGHPLNAPIVGIATTPNGQGYWEVASDGGIFCFGDAQFYGSMGGQPLNAPMVGIAPNLDGHGYWTVASDGGVFSFGDAPYRGSAVGLALDAPVVGIAVGIASILS